MSKNIFRIGFLLLLTSFFILLTLFSNYISKTYAAGTSTNSLIWTPVCSLSGSFAGLPACDEDGDNIYSLSISGIVIGQTAEVWRNIEYDSSSHDYDCALDNEGVSTCVNEADQETPKQTLKVTDKTKAQLLGDYNGTLAFTLNSVVDTTKYTNYSDTFIAIAQYVAPGQTAEDTGEGIKLSTADIEVSTTNEEKTTNSELTPTSTIRRVNSKKDDPYGVVFDAETLEPITGAIVTLLDSNKNVVAKQPGVSQNPYTTKANGQFNFTVDDGSYYLKIEKKGYSFPLSSAEITTLTTNQEIYTDLYTGAVIVQKGAIEHRDVPLKAASGSAKIYSKPQVTVNSLSTKENGVYYQTLYGQVTHPYSEVVVSQNGVTIATTTTDKYGKYQIQIDKSKLDQYTALSVTAKKTINTNNTTSETIDADLNLTAINGYLYDTNGQTLPFGYLEIIVPSLKKDAAVTMQGNSQGYVNIPTALVPVLPYSFKIYDQEKKLIQTITSTEFTTQNKTYLEEKQLDLLSQNTAGNNRSSVTSSNLQKTITPTVIPAQTKTSSKNWLLLILSFVFILIGLGLAVFLRSKKNTIHESDHQSLTTG